MPTETIDLPSKGLLYPEENPLSAGTVEIKYMTAKEEDILTNQSYIKKGIVAYTSPDYVFKDDELHRRQFKDDLESVGLLVNPSL